jgi:hypothetical protein
MGAVANGIGAMPRNIVERTWLVQSFESEIHGEFIVRAAFQDVRGKLLG